MLPVMSCTYSLSFLLFSLPPPLHFLISENLDLVPHDPSNSIVLKAAVPKNVFPLQPGRTYWSFGLWICCLPISFQAPPVQGEGYLANNQYLFSFHYFWGYVLGTQQFLAEARNAALLAPAHPML